MSMSSSMSLWGGDVITLAFSSGKLGCPGDVNDAQVQPVAPVAPPSTMTGVLTNRGYKGTTTSAKLQRRGRGCDGEGEVATAKARLRRRRRGCDGEGKVATA